MKHLLALAQVALNLSTRFHGPFSMIGSTSKLATLTCSPASHVQVLRQPQLQIRSIRAPVCYAKTGFSGNCSVLTRRTCCTVARAASIDETDVVSSTAEQGSPVVPSVNDAAPVEQSAVSTPPPDATPCTDSLGNATQDSNSGLTTTSDNTASIPQLAGSLDAVWSEFLAYLWDKGFFSDHTSPDRCVLFCTVDTTTASLHCDIEFGAIGSLGP